jgi:uncharacterized membrane protein YhaH (DUF805 family)
MGGNAVVYITMLIFLCFLNQILDENHFGHSEQAEKLRRHIK